MPARLSAAATLTLVGKPRAPSRAVPSNTFSGAFKPLTEMSRSTQIRRAFEPGRRLARHHVDRVDGAFGRGAHGVEPDQRAGRHQNSRAFGLGARRPGRRSRSSCATDSGMNMPAFVDGRDGDLAEQRRRQALHHHVAIVGQLGRRAHGDAVADLRQRAPRLVDVAHRDGGERQARHAGRSAAAPRPARPRRGRPVQIDRGAVGGVEHHAMHAGRGRAADCPARGGNRRSRAG